MNQFLTDFWPHLLAIAVFVVEALAASHAVLFKRDSRATIGWVGLILLTPLVGAVLYWMFGINRIHRRATLLRSGQPATEPQCKEFAATDDFVEGFFPRGHARYLRLMHLGERVTSRPLLIGNEVEPLIGGDQAYPAMLAAIDDAQRSISLATYIFDNDRVGQRFADALQRAAARGVEVRVLIDDIGSRYTFPSIVGVLRKAGIRTETFMPTFVPGYFAYSNLRSHRKIMVVDGRLGFTGGMNIREGCFFALNPQPASCTKDAHFRLRGPVVTQLQEVFAEDWAFTTAEVLSGELWYPSQELAGKMLARGIAYGPDEDLGKMRLILIGAIGVARRTISIVTPYFLPDDALIAALNVAALRGVQVNVVLPEHGNLATVQWASRAMLWQILERGCRVWLSPPPFDHTKLMVVDDLWSVMGSGNWDPRSLRLNFEFNVEVYDAALAEQLTLHMAAIRASAREITLADVDSRMLPARLRDGVARLFSPYL